MAERCPLLLIGAGGLAREVAQAVLACDPRNSQWALAGLLDDAPHLHGTEVGGLPVLGPVALAHQLPAAAFVCCVANPKEPRRRQRLLDRLGLPDHRFATIVHPAASLARDTLVGPGSVLLAHVVATAGVTVGRHVVVMPAAVFTHDDSIGDYATVAAGVRLAGQVRVGTAAYLGAGCLVREELAIGPGTLVGMGAVVTRDVPADSVVAGIPARLIGAGDVESWRPFLTAGQAQ